MKKFVALLLILTLVFTFTACSKENVNTEKKDTGETLKLRVANVTQIDHPMNKSCEVFAEKISEKSNGRIQITNFPARQLGDDRELFEQVQQGALDMALVSVAPIGSTTPLAAAFQLPFVFEDWDQWLSVMNNKVADDLFAEFQEFNVKALGAYNSGFRHLMTVDKPINAPDDLKGMKFRIAETPLHVEIFSTFGASPTPIPYGEIYTSLQNKVIDGLEMDYPAMVMEKHYEVAKHVTATGHFTWPGILMINLELWNSLSDAYKQLFIEVSKEVYNDNVEYIKEQEAKAVSELEKAGIEIIYPTGEQKQAFIDSTSKIAEKYTSQNPVIKAFVDYALSLKK